MTAESRSSINNFLNDFLAPLVESFSKRTVLQDELGRNTRRSNFSGLQIRVPILFAPKQGTGNVAETGTVNVARQLDDRAAYIKMTRVAHAIELSEDLLQKVEQREFVAAGGILKMHMDQAEVAMSRVENEQLNGAGDALLAAITGANTAAVVPVGTTANFYQLYPGRIVDILVRSSGATISLARTIVSNDPAAGTVTLDATVVTASTSGIYVEGSYGNAIQGVRMAAAASGTVEGVDLATNSWFRSIDGRGGVTTAADLSMALLDGAYRRVMMASGKAPDFFLGDPAVIDKFGQSLISQFRWQPKITRLQTGWEGIDYRGTPLIPEFDAPAASVTGINKSALTLYSYGQGPQWLDDTGSKFQRFSRALTAEAWLVDFVQLGLHQPAALVYVNNLNQAT